MTATRSHILVIEDDPEIGQLLQFTLRDEGYAVRLAESGETGLAILQAERCDLLLLDLVLPGIDGLEICRKLRSSENYLPIIIISSKSLEMQRVLGLELGADDYVTKPFSSLELTSRVRALLRRVAALKSQPHDSITVFETDHLRLDPRARDARLDDIPIALTQREFDLLHFFMRHGGQVFSRTQLLNQVWGQAHDGYEHTVNSHINRLRAKIESDPARPKYIVTVWGVGYKFGGQVIVRGEGAT